MYRDFSKISKIPRNSYKFSETLQSSARFPESFPNPRSGKRNNTSPVGRIGASFFLQDSLNARDVASVIYIHAVARFIFSKRRPSSIKRNRHRGKGKQKGRNRSTQKEQKREGISQQFGKASGTFSHVVQHTGSAKFLPDRQMNGRTWNLHEKTRASMKRSTVYRCATIRPKSGLKYGGMLDRTDA